MRAIGISLLSLALTTVVIANAYYQKKQFYPSVVYITKSNPSLAVIYIQAFICVLLAGKLMRKIFFGELRASEFEHLLERFWYAITETCLAFTVFRDDFNPKFVSLFTILLFLKSFHWLAEDRVDYMERSPIISPIFHIRVLSLLVVLGALDIHFICHAYESTVQNGASVQLVFGFEYAILATMVINVAIKYALYSVDLHSETPWDNKAVFLLYTELVMGLIKVLLYVVFVGIMVRIYTLPLFALRPMYYTARNFRKALNDVIMSRRAIHNMNTLYLDATAEELAAGDNVCIICREEMLSAAKKLPCNHIFHTACLRSWFQRQQTCPTCRLNILRPAANANINAANVQQQNRARAVPNNIPNPFMNMNLNGPNPFAVFNQQMRNIGQAAAAAVAPQPNANIAQGGDGQAAGTPGVGTGGVPQGTGTVPNAAAAAGVPPHMMPPFPPFPPFPMLLTPPPMPTQNVSELTPEQLRQMEGQERENVEARIAWLRSIGIMLDTAVVMLQQYNTAAAFSRMPMPSATSGATQSSSNDTTSTATTSIPTTATTINARNVTDASTSPPPTSTSSCSSTSSSTQEARVSISSIATAVNDDQISSSSAVASTSAMKTSVLTNSTVIGASAGGTEDELRRRRLQRFEQTATAPTTTTTAQGDQ